MNAGANVLNFLNIIVMTTDICPQGRIMDAGALGLSELLGGPLQYWAGGGP
jgi:hypothetical protein